MLRILYIGGTGDISLECVRASAALGHACTVFNRGRSAEPLPEGVRRIAGDVADAAAYSRLGEERFDVVCQFVAYAPADVERDLCVFSGRCAQYVFISTASAYLKPPAGGRITEDTPLANPFWRYSQAKADMERMLLDAHDEGRLPVTIVRPSHTYRRRFPGTFVSGDVHAWRMLRGRPVVLHADGQSLWTLTHARDFAPPFARLLGNAAALGEGFHLTTDTAYTWTAIFGAVGRALGVEPRIVHVPARTIVRYRREWEGPLLGDKAWTTLFDHAKIEAVAGPVRATVPLDQGMAEAATFVRERLAKGAPPADEATDALIDRMIDEQERLGTL